MIMTSIDACPGPNVLRDYMVGISDESRIEAIESHLAVCPECEQTLVALEQDGDTILRQLRAAAGSEQESMPIDSVLQDAFDSSRRLVDASNFGAVTSQPAWIPAGNQIGPYRLLRPIGSGGMGAVYLARHCELGKQVAIKLLPFATTNRDQRLERFLREIRAAGSLEHSSIVNSTDAGRHDEVHYLVMEYIDGLDVGRIARAVKLSVADACEVVRQAALGLAHAHAEGVVHRDIKPSNLMLSREGEVKILDFGLAQISTWDGELAELTTVGQLMGTLDYMSPEQAEQPAAVDYRADLYSLGATLFRLITGRAPLAAAPNLSPLAKLRLLANHCPPKIDALRPGLPPKLVELTACMLSSSPSDRPASASHVAESLAEFCSDSDLGSLVQDAAAKSPSDPGTGPPTGSVTSPPVAASELPPKGRRWWIAAILIPCAILAAVTIHLQTDQGQLIIESEVDDVSIRLVQDGRSTAEVMVEPGVNSTRLRSGTYEIVLGAGSDLVSVDKGVIKIRRGETSIARVRESPETDRSTAKSGERTEPRPIDFIAAMRGNAAVPASDQPLMPGQRLKLISAADKELGMNLTVMADHTIKPRLAGVVSVRGQSLAQVEKRLNEIYRKWYDDPAVELFVEFDTPERDSGDDGAQKLIDPTKDAPVYEGQSLAQWLDVVATEREDSRLEAAMKAVENLATQYDRDRVLNVVIANQQRISKHLIANVLVKVISQKDYAAFYIEQLESGQPKWAAKIINIAGMMPNDIATNATLCEWILDLLLVEATEPPLLRGALDYCLILEADEHLEAPIRDRIRNRLHDAAMSETPIISRFYWFNKWDSGSPSEWLLGLIYEVAKDSVVRQNTSPYELSAALAALRYQQDGYFSFSGGVQRDPVLTEAIARRLRETDRQSWSNEVDEESEWSLVRPEEHFFGSTRLSRDFTRFVRIDQARNIFHADPIVELLQLTQSSNLTNEVRPQLQKIETETLDGYNKVRQLFDDGFVQALILDWRSMTPMSFRKNDQNKEIMADGLSTSSQDWFDAYVHIRAKLLLEQSPVEKDENPHPIEQ